MARPTANNELPYLSTHISSLATPSMTSSTTPFISNPITSLTTPPLPTPLTTPRATTSLATSVLPVTTPITTSLTPPTSTISAPVSVATPPSQKPINLSSHWASKKPQPSVTKEAKTSITPTTTGTPENLLVSGSTCIVSSSVNSSCDVIVSTRQNNVTQSLRNGPLCATNTIDNSGRLLLHNDDAVSNNTTTNIITTVHAAHSNAVTSAIGPGHMVNATGIDSTISTISNDRTIASTTGTTAKSCTCPTTTDSKGIYTTACPTNIDTSTVQAGLVSSSATINRSAATTAVIDNKQYERWSIEREKRLQAQREEEERQRIKIQQELLALQQEEEKGRDKEPEASQTKMEEKDLSKGNASETDDDKSEAKWTMAQYMSSVKEHSNSNHYQTRIHQVREFLNYPINISRLCSLFTAIVCVQCTPRQA